MTMVAGAVLVAGAFAAAASAQTTVDGDAVSISDVRPLARAAESTGQSVLPGSLFVWLS
jgi:hypothetical protein